MLINRNEISRYLWYGQYGHTRHACASGGFSEVNFIYRLIQFGLDEKYINHVLSICTKYGIAITKAELKALIEE
jgi:hypothetical protein